LKSFFAFSLSFDYLELVVLVDSQQATSLASILQGLSLEIRKVRILEPEVVGVLALMTAKVLVVVARILVRVTEKLKVRVLVFNFEFPDD
jgi:hypothetical protein